MKKYPKITKENFEKIVPTLIKEAKVYNYSWKNWDTFQILNISAPTNDKEFGEVTKKLYGIKLSVDCLAYPIGAFGEKREYACKYEIRESQNDYSKGKIYQLWEKKFSQYDGLKPLLNLTFGRLSCGGVAGSHYGQTNCDKKTWERVKNWNGKEMNDVKTLIAARKQHESMKEIFGGVDPFIK